LPALFPDGEQRPNGADEKTGCRNIRPGQTRRRNAGRLPRLSTARSRGVARRSSRAAGSKDDRQRERRKTPSASQGQGAEDAPESGHSRKRTAQQTHWHAAVIAREAKAGQSPPPANGAGPRQAAPRASRQQRPTKKPEQWIDRHRTVPAASSGVQLRMRTSENRRALTTGHEADGRNFRREHRREEADPISVSPQNGAETG
jgi:hypothetical protein